MKLGAIRLLMRSSAVLVTIAAASWLGYSLALSTELKRLHAAAEHRLDLVAARLDGELVRFEYLPSLLEAMPGVAELLTAPTDHALRERVSRQLRTITDTAGADNLYVVQPSGLVLAAADWDRPGTPQGVDLSFRPYLREALAVGRARFFGVGYTTGRTGYYVSYGLRQAGSPVGVATVKISLEAIERSWAQLPGEVVVIDRNNVVILASRPEWKLRPLSALSEAALDDATKARTYGDAVLVPLEWRERERRDANGALVRLGSTDYLSTEREINGGLWRMALLDSEAPAVAAARSIAVIAALAWVVLLLLGVSVVQRRRTLRLQHASRHALQRAHDGLEMKVRERTAELEAAHNELVHAGQLAVLGQMSAGLAHELNQPLAALRTLSDNAAVLMDRGRLEDARSNLQRIGKLTERLARLTQQLKAFAYKGEWETSSVALRGAVQNALAIVSDRLSEAGIDVEVSLEPESACVVANGARLEQVFVNIFLNAIDAMAQAPRRHLDIRAEEHDGHCMIEIADSGTGIDPQMMGRLFEPFVTTKPAGKGLGLGLMLSDHIVREFHGRIEARNRPEGGAEFVIQLPAVHPAPAQ